MKYKFTVRVFEKITNTIFSTLIRLYTWAQMGPNRQLNSSSFWPRQATVS